MPRPSLSRQKGARLPLRGKVTLAGAGARGPGADFRGPRPGQSTRSASIFLTSAMARAGFSPLGQTWAQFMMVWQR